MGGNVRVFLLIGNFFVSPLDKGVSMHYITPVRNASRAPLRTVAGFFVSVTASRQHAFHKIVKIELYYAHLPSFV